MSAGNGAGLTSAYTDDEAQKATTETRLLAANPNALQVRPKESHGDTLSVADFTSWKLNLQGCIAADPRLKPAAKLVAICILHHVNRKSRVAYVSIETVSDKTCIGQRHVRRAIKRLRATGWLASRRTMDANVYAFIDRNMNALIDRLIMLKEAKQARRNEKRITYYSTSDRTPESYPKPSDRTPVSSTIGLPSPTYTLEEHLKASEGLSIEGRTLTGELSSYGGPIVNGAATFPGLPACRRLTDDRPIYVPARASQMWGRP